MVAQCELRYLGDGRLGLFDVKGSTVLQPSRQRVVGVGKMCVIKKRAVWTVGLNEYEFVSSELRNLRPIPTFILNALRAPMTSVPLDTVKHRVGETFYNMLYDYQREGVARLMALGGRGMLADEMGLGKTFQAIGLMRAYPQRRPVVIVCPASVRHNWITNVRNHVTQNVQGIWKGSDVPQAEVLVLSYNLLATVKPKGGYYFYDESHKVKNATAQVTRAAVTIGRGKPHVLISGTPMTAPVHLFSQMCLMRRMFNVFLPRTNYRPGRHGDAFADRYCKPVKKPKRVGCGGPEWDLRGADRLPELGEIMRRNYWVRRLKKDVKDDLPAKVRKYLYIHKCKGTPKKCSDPKALQNPHGDFTRAVVDTCLDKIDPVCLYIRNMILPRLKLDKSLKVLLFAHHAPMIQAIAQEVAEFKHIYVDGKVDPKKRGPMFEQFQTDKDTRVAVLSITATDTGITLTAARLAVVAELRFGPDTMQQMEGRFHRVGQTHPVVVEYLMADNSTDESVCRMLDRKEGVSTTVMDDDRKRFKADEEVNMVQEMNDIREEEKQTVKRKREAGEAPKKEKKKKKRKREATEDYDQM